MSNITPRVTRVLVADDQEWIYADISEQAGRASITLDLATFEKDVHFPDGFLPSGIPLGKITTGGKYGPYDADATDGRGTCAGFLYALVNDPEDEVAHTALWFGPGAIQEDKLPVEIDAAGKADVAAWFKFF